MKLTQNVYFNILVNLKVKSIYEMICTGGGVVREIICTGKDTEVGSQTNRVVV